MASLPTSDSAWEPRHPGSHQVTYRSGTWKLIEAAGLVEELTQGTVSSAEVGRRIGRAKSTVTRALRYHLEVSTGTQLTMRRHLAKMLLYGDKPPTELEDPWWDKAVEAFCRFEGEYFRAQRGARYFRKHFHKEWIRAFIQTTYLGGQQMVLAPPRHGKSELVANLVVWLICRDPNLRVLWVCANTAVAELMVSIVRNHLEDNDVLISAYHGDSGKTWRPTRGGGKWTRDELVVGNRTAFAQKSPTVKAIGRGGRILSRDVDLIICDDLDDFDSTSSPTTREQTRGWFTTTLDTRKQPETGWLVIGSRQHPDDLYNYLIGDPGWKTLVYQAHDEHCPFPPAQIDLHTDCVLFPEVAPYSWLWEKRVSAENKGVGAYFDMVYNNMAVPESQIMFRRSDIELSYNHYRGLGKDHLPGDGEWRMVAGLDPAATGWQACFLWAYNPGSGVLAMVDSDNQRAGGIEGAYDVMVDWWERYGLSHWVVEENGFQRAVRQDPRIRRFAADFGIWLEGHQTQGSGGYAKADERFGVTGMVRLYDDSGPRADLPYMGPEAQAKTELYTAQLVNFGFSKVVARGVRRQTDLVMASWFPMRVIRRWRNEGRATMSVDYPVSFGGYVGTTYEEAPWH